jgi:hypothetical protein
VVLCANDARYKEDYLKENGRMLHFHKFPKDTDVKKQWIVTIRRDEGPNFKVCLVVFT